MHKSALIIAVTNSYNYPLHLWSPKVVCIIYFSLSQEWKSTRNRTTTVKMFTGVAGPVIPV